MLEKLKFKLLKWLKGRPPRLGPRTIKVVGDDLRKVGLALMGAGLIALFNPTGGFTLPGAIFLVVVGIAIWVSGIALNALAEKVQPKE